MTKVTTKLGLVALVAGLAACQPGASPQPMDMSGLFRNNNQNNQNNGPTFNDRLNRARAVQSAVGNNPGASRDSLVNSAEQAASTGLTRNVVRVPTVQAPPGPDLPDLNVGGIQLPN